MKQKTMDQELMTTLNREAQGEEKRRFEKAKLEVARLENKRKVDPRCRLSYAWTNTAMEILPSMIVRIRTVGLDHAAVSYYK